jgi:hypothetical protein
MDTRNESFEERVATLLDRIAIDVRDPVGGPSPSVMRRVHRRMAVVAVGTALLASALGVAGTMVFGLLTGEDPSIFPHAQRPWQHAFAGSARGDQPYGDHAVAAILLVQQLPPSVETAGPAPTTPTPPAEHRPQRPDLVAAGGDPGLRVIIAGGQFRHHRHHRHHGHHRHHRGGHRRVH